MSLQKIIRELIADFAIGVNQLDNNSVTNDKITNNTISDAKLVLDYLTTDGAKTMLADLDMGNFRIKNLSPATFGTDAPTWKQVLDKLDEVISNSDYQPDVWGIQLDATFIPEQIEGRRYIVTDILNLHPNFEFIQDVGNGDIVEWIDGNFNVVYDVSEKGALALTFNKDDGYMYRWDGSNWVEFTAFEAVVAGAGLVKSGKTLYVGGSLTIQVNEDNLEVRISGDTLNVDANGIKVNTNKVSNLKEEIQEIILTPTDIANKYFLTTYNIVNKEQSYFQVGGVIQHFGNGSVYDVDPVNPSKVTWSGKTELEEILTSGWKIYFKYYRVL